MRRSEVLMELDFKTMRRTLCRNEQLDTRRGRAIQITGNGDGGAVRSSGCKEVDVLIQAWLRPPSMQGESANSSN